MEQSDSPKIDWAAELKQHDRWLRTVVFARCGERAAIDEVMQEVALAAVAQRRPLNDPTKSAALAVSLGRIAVAAVSTSQGRQRKLVDRYFQRNDITAEAPTADPFGLVAFRRTTATIRKALEQLSPRDKELLLLKYTEDWSYRQIADHLGMTNSAVEARLHRARQRMRTQLASLDVIEVGP